MEFPSSVDPGSGPNWPTEHQGPASQPLLAVASRLTARTKRRFSDLEDDLQRHHHAARPQSIGFNVLLKLQGKVLQDIVARLESRGIQTSGLTATTLSWCLPITASSHANWAKFLEQPLTTPPAILDTLLRLRVSGQDRPSPPLGTTLFYIRTLAFRAHELRGVLQTLFNHGYQYHGKVYSWIEALHASGSGDKLYLRYCGQTKGRRPWDRHQDDLRTDSYGYTFRFLQETNRLFPGVIAGVRIQELSLATIDVPVPKDAADIREQVLIALFGDGCINIESGGKHGYIVQEEERDAFLSLNTETLNLLQTRTQHCSQEVEAQVRSYVSAARAYANSHPFSTGSFRRPYTAGVEAFVAAQALPSLTSDGNSVMVTIGSDIPDPYFAEPRQFFSTRHPGRSAANVIMVYNHFGAWEGSNSVVNERLAVNVAAQNHFPFVNLFPWAKKDWEDLEAACGLLRRYLSASKPLIVLPYGHKVSNIALSGFSHQHGVWTRKHGDFLTSLGVPHLSHIGETNDPSDNDMVIVIPCYHPGWNYYLGALRERSCAVFTGVSAVAWLAMTEVLRLSNRGMSRKDICMEVVRLVGEKTGPHTPFGQALEHSKREFLSELNQLRNGNLSETQAQEKAAKRQGATGALIADLPYLERKSRIIPGQTVVSSEELEGIRYILVRGRKQTLMTAVGSQWQMAQRELGMIISCGYSRGLPDSQERLVQAQDLFERLTVESNNKATEDTRDSFIRWAMNVRDGISYYFAAAHLVDCILDIPNLLCCFIDNGSLPDPASRLDPDILRDNDTMRAACKLVYTWLVDLRLCGLFNSAMTVEEALEAIEPAWFDQMEKLDPSYVRAVGKKNVQARRGPDVANPLNSTEVTITTHKMKGCTSQVRNGLRWVDDKGDSFEVENLLLPSGVMPQEPWEQRFLLFKPEGLDIQDAAGQSLGLLETTRRTSSRFGRGTRASGASDRAVTLPLRTIILSLTGHPSLEAFLALWEKRTGLVVEAALNSSFPQDSTLRVPERLIFPASFFKGCKRPLPVIVGTIKPSHRKEISMMLPAQPGDMLWLVDRFLLERYPEGGDLDFVDPQHSTGASIWACLSSFCISEKYSQHPHIRTLKAIAETSSKNTYEKQGAAAMLIASLEVLRTPFSKKKKTIRLRKGSDAGSTTSRTIVTIGSKRPDGAIAQIVSP